MSFDLDFEHLLRVCLVSLCSSIGSVEHSSVLMTIQDIYSNVICYLNPTLHELFLIILSQLA